MRTTFYGSTKDVEETVVPKKLMQFRNKHKNNTKGDDQNEEKKDDKKAAEGGK